MGTATNIPTPKTFEQRIEQEFPEKEKFIGFLNKNNICYANSVTQCLKNSKLFKKNVLNASQTLV